MQTSLGLTTATGTLTLHAVRNHLTYLATILYLRDRLNLTLNWIAAREWISVEPVHAGAHGLMVLDVAHGIEATGTGARILALSIYTREIGRAILMDQALGPAAGRRA